VVDTDMMNVEEVNRVERRISVLIRTWRFQQRAATLLGKGKEIERIFFKKRTKILNISSKLGHQQRLRPVKVLFGAQLRWWILSWLS